MDGATRRFACTQCGKCCDRSPEVELSEAAPLADVFVFRLMFRLNTLPKVPDRSRSESTHAFYERKRLFNAHAARAYPTRRVRDGKPAEYINYLMISALATDAGRGACAALSDNRCGIYDRRPLGCRTVPFHYSRSEASAERDLAQFVGTPGYACNVGATAPIVLDGAVIVDEQTKAARSKALALAEADRAWKEAIVRRMKNGSAHAASLPALRHIEANAQFGALTSSMRVAWEIAVEAGLMTNTACRALIGLQIETIDRELPRTSNAADYQTLREMSVEYRQALTR
jgi:Fe-S-cluster containining protein